MEFTKTDSSGLEWRYQILPLESKVRLYYRNDECEGISLPGDIGKWHFGHVKRIPEGWNIRQTAAVMRRFILGDMTQEEYNTLLPN